MPFETREQAIAIAVSLGCPVGAHKLDDGSWMPCRTQKAYSEAKKKTRKFFKPPMNITKELRELEFEIPKEGLSLGQLEVIEEAVHKSGKITKTIGWINDIFEEFSDMQKNEEHENFTVSTEICKVDESLGLVLGWAIVCKKDGQRYFDLQGDHITENAMLEAATDFMLNSRMAKDMHSGDGVGSIAFAFPLTDEVAKSFGIEANTTGLMIAMKPDDPDILGKFASGEYTGFSIGGRRVPGFDEEINDE